MSKGRQGKKGGSKEDVDMDVYSTSSAIGADGFNITVEDIGHFMSRRNLEQFNKLEGTEGMAAALKTDVNNGLGAEEEEQKFQPRINVYGTNTFDDPPRKNFFQLFAETFKDTTMIILTVAATISFVLGVIPPEVLGAAHGEGGGEWIEGVAIYAAILIVATVTAVNNYTKDKQFQELNKSKNNFPVKVVRRGVETQINNYDVLVGDVVILDTGDQIPADGVYISGFDLYVDESRVTGEADAVRKSLEKDPFLLSGCQITDGVGRMLVVATGMNSEWGKTLARLQEEPEETPLQKKLDDLAVLIGKIGTGVSVAVFIVLTIYWLVDDVANQPWQWVKLRTVLNNFIIAVTIIVLAVPEGLPLAVTISLAYSMKQMMKDANLVRHLEACETMGGATNICSDKTGTLTENRMTVVEGWIAGTNFNKVPLETPLSKQVSSLFCECVAVNSKAYINDAVPGKPIEYIGNKTECALLVFIGKLGADYNKIREANPVQRMYAFSSARKRMSSIIANKNKSEGTLPYRLYIKGASEIILKRCTKRLNEEGEVVPLEEDLKQELAEKIDTLASQGLRTLTLGFRDLDKLKKWKEPPEEDIVLTAIVGIIDPIRHMVPEAVHACQRAGIFVRMVTGDNIKTAKKIAEDCGILTPGGLAIEGPEFAKMSDRELDKILPGLQVLARATPMDKYRLVDRLKINSEVVAVTGDGTNDAAALKKADVGLAMGIMGTEVAKEASDIIILDDNFVSIVRSVMWGRNVYDNIRKFLQFQLTVNVVALLTAFIGAITRYGTPLKAVQLLWVNLIMDTMAALALGTEKPTPDLLNKKPYGRKSPLLSKIMMRNIVGVGLVQLAILLTIIYAGPQIWGLAENGVDYPNDPTVHYTMVFNTFVFLQLFNEFNSRKVTNQLNVFAGIFSNVIFIAVVVVTIVVQVLIVEFGGRFTSTTHLDAIQWISCVGLGLIILPVGFLVRLIPIPLEEFEKPTTDEPDDELEFLTNRNNTKSIPLAKAVV